MKSDFSSWYATSFQQDAAFINMRWEAIDAYAKDLTNSSLALLTKLAFRFKLQMSSTEVAELRRSLAGESVPIADEELVMLSASALAIAMGSKDSDTAACAALIVACASCGGLRSLKQPMDLVGQSDNTLLHLSETSRRRPSLQLGKLASFSVDKDDTGLQAALATGGLQVIAEAIVNATNKSLTKMVTRQRQFEASVQKYVTIQDEELDILWWLEGGHSFELNLDFSKIDALNLPLAIALELAELTKVLPGPPALASLLSRTGLHDSSQQPIVDFIQSMPIEWLNSAVDRLIGDVVPTTLTPIMLALHRRLEVNGTDEWIPTWCTMTGLDRESGFSPLQFAVAAYREFSWTQIG